VRPAETVLTNARVYTVDQAQPWARAVAIQGSKIVYVGSERGADPYLSPSTRLYDLHGRLVLPGLIDSHVHPKSVALSAWHTKLPWTFDTDEQLSYLRDWAAAHPEQKVIYAEYYPTAVFSADDPPTAELIDRYVPDRAVIWQSFSDHAGCLNSRALALLGIDRDTPDPENSAGFFQRDAAGDPTGYVTENVWKRCADTLFRGAGWSPPVELTPELLDDFLTFLSSKGVTAIWDAMSEADTLRSARELDGQGKLHMFYEGAVLFTGVADLTQSISTLRHLQARYGGRHIHLGTLKYFLDGTNETGTSAVLQPFANDPAGTNLGTITMSEDDLLTCLLKLNDEDLDLHIHMVGDRAFRTACNAVERAQQRLGRDWRIQVTFTHCELIDPADMPRAAELGIIINWTPHWSGGYFGLAPETWLGEERFGRMYQFNPIIDSGGVVACSSDVVSQYEAHRADPFFSMQAGHTRIDPDPDQDIGVRELESARLRLTDLLRGYTINGAVQLRRSRSMGSIEVGKLANLIVLNEDLFGVAPDRIKDVEPLATMFEGKVVYGSLTVGA
jgi:predicted amidohydrolase YtcJ